MQFDLKKEKKKKKKFANHIGEPIKLSNDEQQNLAKALEDEKFRELLFNYATEISDPEVRAENEKYLQQMERESSGPKNRKLMMPKAKLCLVYTLEKDNKSFYVNVCSGNLVEDAFLGHIKERKKKLQETGEIWREGCCGGEEEGVHWQIPYVMGHPRIERYNGDSCEILDIAFSEKTVELLDSDETFKGLIFQTVREALDGALGMKLKEGHSLYDEPSLGKPSAMSVNMEKKKNFNPFAPVNTSASIIVEPKFELVESGTQDLGDHFGTRKDVFIDRRPKKLIYRIQLPGVKKVSQVELDIEDDAILSVKVSGKYDLSTKIPYPIDDSKCSAEFIKNDNVLKVTLPVLPMEEDDIELIMANFRKCIITEDEKVQEVELQDFNGKILEVSSPKEDPETSSKIEELPEVESSEKEIEVKIEQPMKKEVKAPVERKDTKEKAFKKVTPRPKVQETLVKPGKLVDFTSKIAGTEFKNKYCTELD